MTYYPHIVFLIIALLPDTTSYFEEVLDSGHYS